MQEKNIQLERLVFFSDAVIAIAITLLALELKIGHTQDGHLSFGDVWEQRKHIAAFVLSFINIASFWKTHHMFFAYIKKSDERQLWLNTTWLFFIVTLPFSTSLIGEHFYDTPAMFIYCLNTFFITLFQNLIWDYSSDHAGFIDEEKLSGDEQFKMRLFVNLDMVNALVAIGLSFVNPLLAFILLFTKLPIVLILTLFYRKRLFGMRQGRKLKRAPVEKEDGEELE